MTQVFSSVLLASPILGRAHFILSQGISNVGEQLFAGEENSYKIQQQG